MGYTRATHLLLDNEKRIIAVLLGIPRDHVEWKKNHDEVLSLLQNAASASFSASMTHRRGNFPSVAHGLSFGGGQKAGYILKFIPLTTLISEQEPRHLKHSKANFVLLESLVRNKSVQRICKYASGM